ncbi:MAG: YckD family protein [Firmicutes bacterium]|nr:YckD family protein [Bacillota bacterium]
MRKGFLLAVVVVLVLAMAVPAALALSDNQKVELQKLYEQQHQLRLQIVEKQAEGGIITKEEAATMKERMADGWEYQQERMSERVKT